MFVFFNDIEMSIDICWYNVWLDLNNVLFRFLGLKIVKYFDYSSFVGSIRLVVCLDGFDVCYVWWDIV